MKTPALVLATALACGLAIPASAQAPERSPERAPEQVPAAAVRADPADVGSMDALLAALYDVISGPAGQARDWARFRGLFLPGAILTGTGQGADGAWRVRVMTPEDYVTRNGPVLEREGFFEREIGRTVQTFGAVTSVHSAYEIRATPDGEVIDRGVNAIHLYSDGVRWGVVALTWSPLAPDAALPPGLDGR